MAIYDVLRHGFYEPPVELVERDEQGKIVRYVFVDRSMNETELKEPTANHHYTDSDRIVAVSTGTAAEQYAMRERTIDAESEPNWPFGFATIKDAINATRNRLG